MPTLWARASSLAKRQILDSSWWGQHGWSSISTTLNEITSHQTITSVFTNGSPLHPSGEMADGRRPDGSYGPEYGPLPPEHEYTLYRHMPSGGRDPWPLHHGDFPGRLLERRLRSESFGFSRDHLQPHAPFHIHHVNGSRGMTMNSGQSQENTGLTDDEFREAMDQLRKQKYRPSNPYRNRGDGRAMTQNRAPRAEEPPLAPEERTCTICLETFVPGEQVVVTPCNHMFHQGCLTPWVKGHGNCPVCRFALCQRNTITVDGDYGDLDLDLLAMIRTMEEAFSRVRLSDFMSYR